MSPNVLHCGHLTVRVKKGPWHKIHVVFPSTSENTDEGLVQIAKPSAACPPVHLSLLVCLLLKVDLAKKTTELPREVSQVFQTMKPRPPSLPLALGPS